MAPTTGTVLKSFLRCFSAPLWTASISDLGEEEMHPYSVPGIMTPSQPTPCKCP